MSDIKKDPITNEPLKEDVYDGIQELDNPLPNWWLGTFYLSIIFSVFYFLYYQLMDGPSIAVNYKQSVQNYEQGQIDRQDSKEENQADLVSFIEKSEKITQGQAVYLAKCAVCHGQNGEGGIGPNVTDEYWIHGDGSPNEIFKVVEQGVLDKGMPAWKNLLNLDDLSSTVAFVYSLKGSNPSNAKAPQGEKVSDKK